MEDEPNGEPNGGPDGGRLGDYLDGNLSDPERKAFEAELAADPELKAEADQLRKLESLIEDLPYEEDVPAPVTARIRAALDAEAREAGTTRGGVVPGPGGEARIERRSVPIFRLSRAVWAAAAVVLVAVLLWLITRPPAVPPPSRPVARLFIGKMIGRVIEDSNTRYDIYDPGLERVYHTLNLRDDRAALSYNNAKLLLEWPHRELKRDGNGRLDLADLRPDDERLVRIHAKERLDAFGLIEVVEGDEGMMQASVLFPGTKIKVSGRVLDATNEQPIKNAILIARDGTGFLRAGEDGRFEGEIESIQERPPLLHVFAEGYAEGTRRLGRECLDAGEFEGDFRLEGDVRFDSNIEVESQTGEPLAGAVIMAYAIPPDEDAGRVPAYKRDRPEIGFTNDRGEATLYQLLDCHYRVEIHHENGYFASHEFDPAGSVRRFRVKPAGQALIHLSTVDRKGKPSPAGRVILSVPEVGHDRVIESSRGLGGGDITFRQLGGKTASVHVFSHDCFGYVFTFTLPGGATSLDVDYRIPEPIHEVTGTLDRALAEAVCTIRLTGELEPFPVGGRKTTGHRLTVEVPVDDSGAFRFSRLPKLDEVRLEGRAAVNPWRFIPLESEPSLVHGLNTNRGQTLEIRVSE